MSRASRHLFLPLFQHGCNRRLAAFGELGLTAPELEQVAIEDEGKEPSAKRIAQIIDRARKDGIKRVFYQSEFPKSSVDIVAEDIGAEAVEINPLAENIFENIRHIVTLVTE